MQLEDLVAWADTLGAPFPTADAIAAGATAREIRDLVLARAWHRLGRGWFVSGSVWASANTRQRHRLVVVARLSGKDRRWVAARRSAAVFRDLPLIGDVPDVPQLLRDHEGCRAKGKNRHERVATLTDAEREEVDDVAVCCAARTVVDIARQEGFRNGLVVADGALRRGLSQDELLAMARRCVDWPGGLAALRVAKLSNGLHETPLESLSWGSLPALGIPMPEPQIRVFLGSKLIARVDGLWRERNTIGQADGLLKYDKREDVLADKQQDEMLEDLGFEVARWGWKHAMRARDLLQPRLERAFARGARQTLDPRVRLVPTTLEESLEWTGLIAS